MYYSARITGHIFSKPPFFVLRCMVAGETTMAPMVVKGKIVGAASPGTIITFKGRTVKDDRGRDALEIEKNPIRPDYLQGNALDFFEKFSEPSDKERTVLLAMIAETGANAKILNSMWSLAKSDPKSIMNNPWILVEKGLQFKAADRVGRALLSDNFDPLHPGRVSSAAYWSVSQGIQNGCTFLDANTVFRDVGLLTGISEPRDIAKSVKAMAQEGRLVIEKMNGLNAIYHPSYYQMESEVSDLLLSDLRPRVQDTFTSEYIRGFSRYDLTDDQVRAIRQGLTERVSVVTGLPGTGKTTILHTLCKALVSRKESILLIAPTGIAAKRAQSLTGIEAMTVHRAFGAGAPPEEDKFFSDYEGIKRSEDELDLERAGDPSREVWGYSPSNPRPESVVIIDEASMVDLHLMWRILRGISYGCRVIMVGDAEQLPPVGAGFVLKDVIESSVLPRVHLDKIFRQGEGSDVVQAAHAIHRGEDPRYTGDFILLNEKGSHAIADKIVSLCHDLMTEGVDFHVISPTHHGDSGVTALNRTLRSVLNPNIGSRSVRVGDDEIRVGDRVMITKNDYELMVFNGDLGRIDNITASSVTVMLKGVSNVLIEIPINRVSNLLRLAYATTVHKSQGQEYTTIVMPMSLSHGQMLLKRSLIYTAVTRAKERVYIVGDPMAVSTAISHNETTNRYSRLSERLSAKGDPKRLESDPS